MNGKNAEPPEEEMPPRYVLDSFALIAYLDDEPGGILVRQLVEQAPFELQLYLSIISLGEVIYNTERNDRQDKADEALAAMRRLPIAFIGASEQRVLAAAHIKANFPVSYADAFTIALAQELNATVVTGDPEFESAEKIVKILWLARHKKPVNQVKERRAAYRVKKRSPKRARS